MEIEFTQYLRPDGRRMKVTTEISGRLLDKVKTILSNRFHFEIEELTTGDIHMTISDHWGDYGSRICKNDKEVTKNIESMIEQFDLTEAQNQRIINGG